MERVRTALLYQVETCTKIAVRCVNPQRKGRPKIKDIVEDLNKMETQMLSQVYLLTSTYISVSIFNSLSSILETSNN